MSSNGISRLSCAALIVVVCAGCPTLVVEAGDPAGRDGSPAEGCVPCGTLGLQPGECFTNSSGASWRCDGMCLIPASSCAQDGSVVTLDSATEMDTSPKPAQFPCSGAGIAAFADALVAQARQACTSSGVGVVTNTNYSCLKAPIYALAPFPDVAYNRVEHWAQNGNNYAGKTTLWQCVEFAFIVTGGVCGQLINSGDAMIDVNMSIPGYVYMSTAQPPQAGDVLVMYGHIAITAQVLAGDQVRIAEANCLTVNGTIGDGYSDTGVVSNTRTDTISDPWILGWYRKQ